MAKLSAHGHEVARVVTAIDYDGSDRELEREENHFSYRSDGHILKRHVVVFRNRSYDKRHDYGWKLHKRFTDRAITPERVLAAAQAQHDRIAERDYELPDVSLSATITTGVTL